jgi:hypothetical protein
MKNNILAALSGAKSLPVRFEIASHSLYASDEPRSEAASLSLYASDEPRSDVISHSLYASNERSGAASHSLYA